MEDLPSVSQRSLPFAARQTSVAVDVTNPSSFVQTWLPEDRVADVYLVDRPCQELLEEVGEVEGEVAAVGERRTRIQVHPAEGAGEAVVEAPLCRC